MPIAILDPFSGISGDMTLGALIDVGLDAEWLRALPGRLRLEGVRVTVHRVRRGEVDCAKVDFDIPPQPHGRHLSHIHRLVAEAELPEDVRARADAAFTAIAEAEAEIHGIPVERVHLHEVGAVDAILDVVGAVWGFRQLGVTRVYCGAISLGDGTVHAAHGELPVPAPATLKLLEGHPVRPGPAGSGELVTPTGAALVRVLSSGPPPTEYVPLRSGFGAGTRELAGRANALRIVLAEPSGAAEGAVQTLVLLAADVDDMDGESLAGAADALRAEGALDVVLVPTVMKKGRPGTRLEVLCAPASARRLEDRVLQVTTSLGVRRTEVQRRALAREMRVVRVHGHDVRVKVATLPDGAWRAKPEYDDLAAVAAATGMPVLQIAAAARRAAELAMEGGVTQPASGALA
jgi:uncharacterized protein (TIGR00299 family) protein